MQDAESDCVLVTVDDRLVGIFTDRDAVVKAAGKHLDAFHVRDFMTADPVVLRHDDPIAIAIHKMAVGGLPAHPDHRGRPADRRRHRPRRLPPPRGDARLTAAGRDPRRRPDLGDRLARPGPGARAPSPCPVRTAAAFERALPDVDRVDRRPDRARLRRRRGHRASPHAAGGRVLAVGQHDDVDAAQARRWRAGADRVLAYRKLFEDGPRQTIAALASTAGRRSRRRRA